MSQNERRCARCASDLARQRASDIGVGEALAQIEKLTKSRDEAWARVSSAEESERKAQAVARDLAVAAQLVTDAVKAEREACAQAVAALRIGGCFDDIQAAHERSREMALINAEDAIRARKP